MTVDIGDRRELFVDHALIDKLDNVALDLKEPRPGGVAIRFDEPWEGQFCGYNTVIRDGDTYLLYYRGNMDESADPPREAVTCRAVSADGREFTKPRYGMCEVDGSSDNNVILADGGTATHNFSPFIDTRPGVAADERFKALAGLQSSGLLGFTSADGIHWSQIRDEPLIPSVEEEDRYDSQNLAFWSEHEGCYVCYFRAYRDGVRKIARSVSADFLTWSERELMDLGDTADEHLYVNQTTPYFRAPHIYISLPARFMSERKILSDEEGERYGYGHHYTKGVGYWQDCAETLLMTSRGGTVYDRTFMQGFVRPGLDRRNWGSRCNYATLGVVQTGPEEMSIYVDRHNAQPDKYLERLTLRLDGFASIRAPYAGGEATTKLLRFDGAQLEINYATGAGGHVRVELQEEDGRPIDGFGAGDCELIVGDEIERVVRWGESADVSKLVGRPVKVRFDMKDADLYSMRFGPASASTRA